jgi:DNA-directed RNA polymerase subunit beta'
MVLGCYYLTKMIDEEVKYNFVSIDDAMSAYEAGAILLYSPINVRLDGKIIKTTYGRLIFNEIVPKEL